ncbi:PREDICTED: zinc finger protein 473 [Condylura cristata]|uniref:zinc finger protein 473 n=1 Tax=Condylura cristata TaxID=143302 RepID=UPI000334677C|nr:PREDICTED: zinc finger protein 473 [Condylura cristata]XP_012589023.1 PREDICTED: zinc finger protein 473 [Condylura cristata]
MTEESVTLKDVAMDFTLEDWEQLGPDQGDLFWDTALDNYQNLFLLNPPRPSLTAHLDGAKELDAQPTGSLEAAGPDVAEAKTSLPQDFVEGLSLGMVGTFPVEDLMSPSPGEAGTGESWLASFLEDPESVLKSDAVTRGSPTERKSHRFWRGPSPQPLLFTGEDFMLHGLPERSPAAARSPGCGSAVGRRSGGAQPDGCSERGTGFGQSHHLSQPWAPRPRESPAPPQEGQSPCRLLPLPRAGYRACVYDTHGQELRPETRLRQQEARSGETPPESTSRGHAAGPGPQLAGLPDAHRSATEQCDEPRDSPGRAVRLGPRRKTPARPRYGCAECEATFSLRTRLLQHQKSHARAAPERQEPGGARPVPAGQEEPHACDKCGKAFSHASALKTHQRAHGGEKPHACGECGKAFSRVTHLREHQRVHTGYRPHRCQQCVKSFSRPSHLMRHQATHAAEKPYGCPQCKEAFGCREHLAQHQQVHAVETPYECQECGERFTCRSTLTCHQSLHARGPPGGDGGRDSAGQAPGLREPLRIEAKCFKCQTCEKTFSCRKYLSQHERIHTRAKPFGGPRAGEAAGQSARLAGQPGTRSGLHECGRCGRAFLRGASLARHQAVHTGERPSKSGSRRGAPLPGRAEKPFKCSQCDRAFAHSHYLSQHQKAHAGRTYECQACGKRFQQNSCLTKHQRIHTGEKPHVCGDCGKAFGLGARLTRHLRVHTRAKPYVCQQCGKAFSQSSCLAVHLRVHTGERPYLCAQCGKAFTQKANLTQHERTHSGERPHTCDVCGRAFSLGAHLTQHRRIHTQEKPYQCQHCQKAFRCCSGLSRHQRGHTQPLP